MSNKKEASPQKVAANRANAKRSTGPTTLAGKAKASQNAYKHGVHAKHLFPNNKLRAQDGADYDTVYAGLRAYYSPQGFMEDSLVEEIAVQRLRLTRLLKYDQEQQGQYGGSAFVSQGSMPNIIRYETAVNRRIQQATERLEALQEKRFAEEAELELESEGLDGSDAAGEPEAACPEPPADDPNSGESAEACN